MGADCLRFSRVTMKKDDKLAKRYPSAQLNDTQVVPSHLDATGRAAKRHQARILKAEPSTIHVKVRPNIENISEDTYFVMARVMERLAQKVADGDEDLSPGEVTTFSKFADILVKMRREDRMSLGELEEELELMTDEEQAKLARQLAAELEGEDEA